MKFLSKSFRTIGFTMFLAAFGQAFSASAAIANISVINFAFVPAATNISVGDTVIWTWPAGSANHNVVTTASPKPAGWTNEPTLFSGPAAFTNTFTVSGNFPYQCTLHHFTGSITVAAAANVPPTVSIASPAPGTVFAAPANITIQATASDSDGSVTNVQFLVGATVLNDDDTAPFSGVASNLAAGNYTLSAIASDNRGAKSTNAISVSVVMPVQTSLGGVGKFSSAGFQFDYSANVGLGYVIQRSTDLALPNWITIATNVAASNPVVFVDVDATNSPNFYRIGRLPNP